MEFGCTCGDSLGFGWLVEAAGIEEVVQMGLVGKFVGGWEILADGFGTEQIFSAAVLRGWRIPV